MSLTYLDSANVLNRGTVANDGTGDTLRTAADKINTNFAALDSALEAIGAGGGAGTSSTYNVALSLLDSPGRAGTELTARLGVGKVVYYDSDAGLWTGAFADSAHVGSHVIVKYEGRTGVTDAETFDIAQTGVFTLESDGTYVGGLASNNYYFLNDSAGTLPRETSVTTGIHQLIYYTLDSNQIDLNISEAQQFQAGASFFEQFPTVTGGSSTLSLAEPINVNTVDVFKNGVLLVKGGAADYTVTNSNTIALNDALDDSDIVSVRTGLAITVPYDISISGTTAAAPSPSVTGDTDTGLFSDAANTLNVSAGGSEVASFTTAGLDVTGTLSVGGTSVLLSNTDLHDSAAVQGQIDATIAADVTFGSDVTVSGIGIPNTTTLSGIGAVTYTLTDGNTASLTTDSNKTITFDGTWTGIVGSGFSLMILNSDADSDRTMTFEAGTGKTVKFNSANTLTVGPTDFGVASVLVFDANTILVTATSLDSSLTF